MVLRAPFRTRKMVLSCLGGPSRAGAEPSHRVRPQVIQKISAVDKDEPSNGHQFYFSLTTDATNNHNFSLRDNKGEWWCRPWAVGTDSQHEL